jgi:hypothetical protein
MSVFSTNPLAKAYFAEMNIFSQRAKSEFFEGEGKTANPSAQRRQRITFKEGRVVSLDEYQIKTPEHMRLVMKLLSHRENEMIVGKGHCCISNSPAFQFFDRLVTRAENWVLTESECYEFCASGQQRHAQTLAEEARKKSETPLKQFTAEELQHAATAWASRHETERHDASLARELAETYGPLSIQESLGGRVPPQHQSSVQESAKLSTSKSQMKPQIEWISTLLPMDSTSRSKMTGAQLGQIPVAPLISSLHQSGSISSASPTHRPSTSIHLQSVASSSMQGQNPTAGRKT